MGSEQREAKFKNLEDIIKNQERQLKVLGDKVRALEDIQEIMRLQRIYGYYLEHWMTQEILDCFSDSPDCELDWMEGKWLGKEGVRRYFQSLRTEISDPTFMHQLMQVSGVIDVDPDGKKAKGRWYGFGAVFKPKADEVRRSFAGGIYENEYVKEDGNWKILKFSWTAPYSVTIAQGWETSELRAQRILSTGVKYEPDIPYTSDPRWVTGYIRPFHYKHPVTRKETTESKSNARLKKFQSEKS